MRHVFTNIIGFRRKASEKRVLFLIGGKLNINISTDRHALVWGPTNQMKREYIESFIMIVVIAMFAYIGYACGVAQTKKNIGLKMAENVAAQDSIDAATNNSSESIVVLEKLQPQTEKHVITAEVSDSDYEIICRMFDAAMSVDDLRADAQRIFPKEYELLENDAKDHDCVECRLKCLAACYYDGVWADCFDPTEGIGGEFERVLSNNAELGRQFHELADKIWR